jgi:hypothetical protein
MVDNHLAIQGGVQSLNLIHEPFKAAMLHGSGIPVLVPAPEVRRWFESTRRYQP